MALRKLTVVPIKVRALVGRSSMTAYRIIAASVRRAWRQALRSSNASHLRFSAQRYISMQRVRLSCCVADLNVAWGMQGAGAPHFKVGDEMSAQGIRTYPIQNSLLASCQTLGISAHEVLAAAGVGDKVLREADPAVSEADLLRIFGSMAMLYGRVDMPIRLGQGFANAPFAPAVLAFTASADLVEGVERMQRFKQLIGPGAYAAHVTQDGVFVRYELYAPLPPEYVAGFELLEVIWLTELFRKCTGTELRPLQAVVSADVACREEAEQVLGCPLAIGAPAGVLFSTEDAALPLLSKSPDLLSFLEVNWTARLKSMARAAPMSLSVSLELQRQLPTSSASVGDIARKLGVSARTLQRKLAEEGTTFQALRDETRLEMALHYTKATVLCFSEITYLLGFSDPNSFFRFFREKTGKTPSEVRASRDLPVATFEDVTARMRAS